MSVIASLYIDAAAKTNPKEAAGAAVFKTEDGTIEYSEYFGALDNHEAEWAALMLGVEKALELNIRSLIIYTDSKIISDSFEKNHVKNKKFRPYFDRIKKEMPQFDLFLVSHMPRKNNKNADRLAKDALYSRKKK